MFAPDLYTRATHFFLLAEQASRWWWWTFNPFWTVSASFALPSAAHLPGLWAAVTEELESSPLQVLACHPLPARLSLESVPWYDALVAAWEIHRISHDPERHNPARLALVRLDGCGMPDGMERPSRLPEWLAEARRIVGAGYEPARTEPARTGEWQVEDLKALAALAAWRPAPGVVTSLETLGEWVGFWRHIRQSRSPLLKGIAAKALLNLPETDLRAASLRPVPPEQLLRELAKAIPVAAERTTTCFGHDYLFLLDWQPGENSPLPAAGVAEVARAWLNITRHALWHCRQSAWEQLTRWDRAGSLTACGIDLLPHLVPVVKDGKDGASLHAVSHWTPTAQRLTRAGTESDFALLRELEAGWQQYRQAEHWTERQFGWLGSIGLYQAGLASESPATFSKAYLSVLAQERNTHVLFVLAQWAPGPDAPPAVHRKWQQRWQRCLVDRDESLRQMAAFAVARHVLEQSMAKGPGNILRRTALEAWRAGTKAAAVTHRMGNIASRFHEVRAELVAGTVPDFDDDPLPPVQRHHPRLALPSGRLEAGQWQAGWTLSQSVE